MMQFAIQLAVSFAATIAFAILFHAPRKEYLYCGATGAAGWAFYLVAMHYQPSPVVASLVAVLVLAVMARIFAVIRRCPSTIFLVCGIFPLVPGAGIYYTAYHFIMGENELCAAKGVETIKIAVVIALGIVFVLSLPCGMFNIFAKKTKNN
ncbi:MAG: threonine/serine exporter family protein [Oscillospiraceae bacterium]